MTPLAATPMKESAKTQIVKPVQVASNGMITLSTLHASSTRGKYKRVGRGNSSGKGTTAGRGTKGQRARTGGRNKLTRRSLKSLILPTPKHRGFISHKPKLHVVTLEQLQSHFTDGATITPAELATKGLIPSVWPGVKVLASGKISKKFTVRATKFSAGAAEAITKVGGTTILLTKSSRTLPKKQRSQT